MGITVRLMGTIIFFARQHPQ